MIKEKLIQVADSKVTWLAVGSLVGTLFGDTAAGAVNAVGALVMAIL